ncbi:MAG TPA: hypothetical protein VGJ62_06015 [Gemmatimonadaceae bacterium]
MKVSSISAAALAVLLSATLGCSADRIASPSHPTLSPGAPAFGAVDENQPSSYTWHVNNTVTEASNGDRIRLAGTGPLGLHPKSASGGGTFTHTNAEGTVLGSGTWTVSELLSFQSYGASPILPPAFNGVGGKAQLRVQLTPTGTTIVLEGIMDIECRLPGLDVPGGIVEGVNLVVPGVANFNNPVSGSTLFRKIS